MNVSHIVAQIDHEIGSLTAARAALMGMGSGSDMPKRRGRKPGSSMAASHMSRKASSVVRKSRKTAAAKKSVIPATKPRQKPGPKPGSTRKKSASVKQPIETMTQQEPQTPVKTSPSVETGAFGFDDPTTQS